MQAILEKEFHLAILDMRLPDGNGKDVWEVLRKKGVPVIFFTVEDDEREIVECLEQGAA